MYTWEIQDLMRLREYLLSAKEYINMLSTSPQIIRCSYNSYNDEFELWTEEGVNLKFKVFPDNDKVKTK